MTKLLPPMHEDNFLFFFIIVFQLERRGEKHTVLEFQNLWGLGIEQEQGLSYRPARLHRCDQRLHLRLADVGQATISPIFCLWTDRALPTRPSRCSASRRRQRLACRSEKVAEFFIIFFIPLRLDLRQYNLCILTPHTLFRLNVGKFCVFFTKATAGIQIRFLIRAVYFQTVLWIRIRRIRKVLGLPDPNPDPLVRGTDPDPSIIQQKQ